MPAPGPLPRAARLGLKATAALAFLAPLATRITMGHVFYLTGNGKIENFDNTVEFFASQNIPFPALNAAFVSRLEYYGGILLVVGLLTRIVAALLASTMVVALLTERAQFFAAWRWTGDVGPADISSWVCLLFFSWLVFYGPGPISLDYFLARWLGLGGEETPPAPASKSA
ncbi:MAG TPA: DoxX family protein [Vicinamibacteria bacterium]|nr:DoxX family protein [Vicinamibacteria bacterium]